MKYAVLLVCLCGTFGLQAQEEEWKEPSKESQAYHEYRLRESVPPYGLEKVKKLIATIPTGDEETLQKPNSKQYQALSLREKFTYHMIHGESFSQNCDAMPPIQEEQQKLFGYLPDVFGEYSWSTNQVSFLKKNRDSVMALIKESVNRSKRMGLNYKAALEEIDGKEMIPFLVATYKGDQRDHDILTLLMLLMKKSNYAPFVNSVSYRKLYGTDASYQAYLDFNKANEELILKRAMDFYNDLK